MTDDIAIKVEHISKVFHEQAGSRSFKEAFVNIGRKISGKKEKTVGRHGDFKALDNINFEVKKGEFFGIVGRNGSGKSTLLKILAGVYTPTKGAVTINGRLTPFIELGVGFNPELSGRDNVYLNAALLGFSRKQTDAMYDDIVVFAELKDFMDVKLKNYSSGMQVRLAFSVAIRAESDILLIDEVLAVGDAAFQRKCFDYFRLLKSKNTTVIFVSHDMESVKEFCDRAILITKGERTLLDSPRKVALEYSIQNADKDTSSIDNSKLPKKNEIAVIKEVIVSKANKTTNNFSLLDDIDVHIICKSKSPLSVAYAISLSLPNGDYLAGINTREQLGKIELLEGTNKISCKISRGVLAEGVYSVNVAIVDYESGSLIDYIDSALNMNTPKINILEKDNSKDGKFNLLANWKINK